MNTLLIKLLLIEDNPGDARLIQEMLAEVDDPPYSLEWADRLSAGLKRLAEEKFDLILLDLSLPDGHGLENFGSIQDHAPDSPVVILTGQNEQSLAIKAVQLGVQDYLVKGSIDRNLLLRSINYAIERHRLQVKLRNLSLTDELTGLYNRRGFLTFAEHHLKLARRIKKGLWLFYIDLDKFKQINDSHGHQEGDRALLKLAELLQETFRASDVIARIGGDEFVVLTIPGGDGLPEATALRLLDNVREYNIRENLPYRLSISVGLGCSDATSQTSIDQLMAQADQKLYQEKRNK